MVFGMKFRICVAVIGPPLDALSAAALRIKAALAAIRARDDSSFNISASLASSPTCGEMSAGSDSWHGLTFSQDLTIKNFREALKKSFKERLRNLEVLELHNRFAIALTD